MISVPYTHAMHSRKCCEAAKTNQVIAGQYVQVKKRGVTYCARIANLWTAPNGLDCWTVESLIPEVARFTVPVRQVRECGQSDCACVAADRAAQAASEALRAASAVTDFSGFSAPGFSQAGVVAPPDSLNIEKTPLFGGV